MTRTGVFLLINGKAELLGKDKNWSATRCGRSAHSAIVFTLGLVAYDLFGIKSAGPRIAATVGVDRCFR